MAARSASVTPWVTKRSIREPEEFRTPIAA